MTIRMTFCVQGSPISLSPSPLSRPVFLHNPVTGLKEGLFPPLPSFVCPYSDGPRAGIVTVRRREGPKTLRVDQKTPRHQSGVLYVRVRSRKGPSTACVRGTLPSWTSLDLWWNMNRDTRVGRLWSFVYSSVGR